MHSKSCANTVILFLTLGCGGCTRSDATEAAAPAFDFVDVAAQAGVDVVNVSGDPRRWYIPESNGNGAAWLDYDSDGDLDLFVANGAGMRYVDDGRKLEVLHEASSRLYRNEGDWEFTDVTDEAGARRSDWMNAVTTGDVDNDGDPDLYLTCFGRDVFLRNDDGHFVDATDSAGLGCELWGAGAAFGDVDHDGDLDLYVANYVLFDPEHPPLEGRRNVIDGVEIAWGPEGENGQGLNPGAPDVFYRGDGKGHFVESTRAAGFELEDDLCSYSVVFADVDGDMWPDVLVANDVQPSNLFMNQGNGTFVDEAVERGFAFDAHGRATSAMGLALGDVDGDGDVDVFRTNFDMEPNCLHVNDGKGRFTDKSAAFGLAEASVDRLGWGAGFFDADCDGDLDLMVSNGHVCPVADQVGMHGWAQRSQLFESFTDDRGRVQFRDVTGSAGSGLAPLRSARGLAFADADDDGDLDALIVDLDGPPRLLRNDSKRRGNWLAVRTVGSASNRDGYGARVVVEAGGKRHVREVRSTEGLYSSHDPRLLFGLGPVERVDSIEVSWPSGRRTHVENIETDRLITLTEPEETNR